MEIKFIIDENNITIKEYLKKINFSSRLARFIKMNGSFIVNEKEVKNYFSLKSGDVLVLKYEESVNEDILPSFEELEIIYEDDYLLVVNKPTSLVSHPSKKHFTDSLLNRAKGYFINQNIDANLHLINRLDASTSGLVLISKSGYIQYLLSLDFPNIKRHYLACVEGRIENKSGVIDLPIAREEAPSIKRFISLNGQYALTKYCLLASNNENSIVKLELVTGRTHQIRVHLSAINHPIIGDKLYGSSGEEMLLHCYYLEFIHPITQKLIQLTNYPKWYKEV